MKHWWWGHGQEADTVYCHSWEELCNIFHIADVTAMTIQIAADVTQCRWQYCPYHNSIQLQEVVSDLFRSYTKLLLHTIWYFSIQQHLFKQLGTPKEILSRFLWKGYKCTHCALHVECKVHRMPATMRRYKYTRSTCIGWIIYLRPWLLPS